MSTRLHMGDPAVGERCGKCRRVLRIGDEVAMIGEVVLGHAGCFGTGMAREPDLSDPAVEWVDRAIKALQREFEDDEQMPRFVVVVETPPEGRIGIASTADDEVDAHRLLTLGAGSVRNSMDPATKARARAYWDQAETDFINRGSKRRRRTRPNTNG